MHIKCYVNGTQYGQQHTDCTAVAIHNCCNENGQWCGCCFVCVHCYTLSHTVPLWLYCFPFLPGHSSHRATDGTADAHTLLPETHHSSFITARWTSHWWKLTLSASTTQSFTARGTPNTKAITAAQHTSNNKQQRRWRPIIEAFTNAQAIHPFIISRWK